MKEKGSQTQKQLWKICRVPAKASCFLVHALLTLHLYIILTIPSKLTAEPGVSDSVPGIVLNGSASTFLSMGWWGLGTFSFVDLSLDFVTNNDSSHVL